MERQAIMGTYVLYERTFPCQPVRNVRKRDQAKAASEAHDRPVATTTDRLRSLIDLLLASIDDRVDGERLTARAYLSRFHFDRVVAAALGETPTAFRRRLLLERAA
jgi:transcriptional regulator GlxA family with amidase domain